MSNVQPAESTFHKRWALARAIRILLSVQVEFKDKLWEGYLHPETHKITLVVHESIVNKVRAVLDWVPGFEAVAFGDALGKAKLPREDKSEFLGLSLDRLQTRVDLYQVLESGLRAAFPGSVKTMSMDPGSLEPKLYMIAPDESVVQRVADLLKEAGNFQILYATEE